MMLAAALPIWRARGPRFLLLSVLLWIALRIMAQTDFGLAPEPITPDLAVRPDLSVRAPVDRLPEMVAGTAMPLAAPPLLSALPKGLRLAASPAQPPAMVDRFWDSPDRHRWRLALFTSLLPAVRPTAVAAMALPEVAAFQPGPTQSAPPPLWPERRSDGWSLSLYSLLRAGGNGPALAANRPPTLGGSQVGARLDYLLGGERQWRAFARVTATPVGRVQAEAALGLTLRPVRSLPLDLYAEQRMTVAGQGRDRTLLYLAGGVDDRPLPHGFRLSAYAQGGVAGPDHIDAFVDGAVVIDRSLLQDKGYRLSLGAVAAGAAQRGAARVDLGPRATLMLPDLGEGARVALDWRERVAGNARPASGLALTLSAGF